jgi:hypothetical protein
MAEQLTKLRPDRDLQCYFQEPSAVAALSGTSANGFTVSGCWRQQFDWTVVEWNRDNVFEHPALRNLPDGDLSGIHLSYEETRNNCMAMDSTVYDAVGWSYLRIWEESEGTEKFHWVNLRDHSTAIDDTATPATAELELQGTLTAGDYVELSWLDQHANYLVGATDTLEGIVAALAGFINGKGAAGGIMAIANGTRLRLTCTVASGANGNRIGIYGGVHGAGTEGWSPTWTMFAGGTSPQRWKVDLDFGNLTDKDGNHVVTTNVRRMRWTWAADIQLTEFVRSEFAVAVSNWQVTGGNLGYKVAGPGSRRFEDDSPEVSYTGNWIEERGNYSGGSIRHSTTPGNGLRCVYSAATEHMLYLGGRFTTNGGLISVQVDGGPATSIDTKKALEDKLIRFPLGQQAGGTHTVNVTHNGNSGSDVYYDFLEAAVPCADLQDFDTISTTTLATDWDTDHSLAIAPERTAWLINKLGFRGRANHYAGALWFYELIVPGNRYASASIEFGGQPEFGGSTTLALGGAAMSHLNLITDTAQSIAKCFELLIATGSSALWARAEGSILTITARAMGTDGNGLSVAATTGSAQFTATVSNATMSGGVAGVWRTDLEARPRLNRAARDWTAAYIRALQGHGIDLAAAFSMEIRDGDDSPATGIAQRYPDGACHVNTPALQTNFGPSSTAFWKQVYADMADVMAGAGVVPYLQFGEVQWWYFADNAGMPFYDDYTKSAFQSTYGTAMQLIPSEHADPMGYPRECAFLAGMIGDFTGSIMAYVRQGHPNTRFEVLYPPDTNDTELCRKVNYPSTAWTPMTLVCLKTENFTYTGNRDLDKALA